MNIGLFFGSFNPIHCGHLIIASYMLNYYKFDEIWFVVSPANPFKNTSELIDARIRLSMVELSIKGSSNFKALDIEFELPIPSYTINTLDILSKKFVKYKFNLIMGSDNILSFNKWKDYKKILKKHEIYVYPRNTNLPQNDIVKHNSVIITEAPIIELSSSFIRNAIADNKYLQYFIPDKVLNFIKNNALYKSS